MMTFRKIREIPIKKCKYCGKKPKIYFDDMAYFHEYIIYCKCGNQKEVSHKNLEKAIEEWNKMNEKRK